MLVEFIKADFVAVMITLFLILFVMTNNNFDRKTNHLFLASACCIMILIAEEWWEVQYSLLPYPTTMRALLSAIGYSLRPLIPFFLLISPKYFSRRKLILLIIPQVFNVLVSFSALFCGISFSYTADNQFERGPLGFTTFIVAAFYIVLLLMQTIRDFRRGTMREALILTAIVLSAFFSTIIESVLGVRFIQTPCMATSVTFYYLFLHSSQNNRDPLTGALTRRKFYLDADKYRSALTAVVSLDLNNLKQLNDEYGHVAGDEALATVAAVVKKQMGPRTALYRTGGDEFMILCYRMDENAVQKMIDRIRTAFEGTAYSCAIGYALCSAYSQFDAVCQTADRKMYENKRSMKADSKDSIAPADNA